MSISIVRDAGDQSTGFVFSSATPPCSAKKSTATRCHKSDTPTPLHELDLSSRHSSHAVVDALNRDRDHRNTMDIQRYAPRPEPADLAPCR
jgi:hypothetical protein